MRKYLKSDLIRVFSNYKIYIAIIIVAFILNMGIEDRRADIKSVLGAFQVIVISKYMIVVYTVCAAVYAGALIDELENGYIKYQVMRGSLGEYIIAKITAVFIASVVTILAGAGLFIFVNSMLMPLTDLACFEETYVQYAFLYNGKFILLWFAIWGIKVGVMIGMLALSAMVTSMFTTNKMLVFAMPALIYELLLELSTELNIFNFAWFNINWPNDDVVEKIRGILFTIICIVLMSKIIVYKLKRRM